MPRSIVDYQPKPKNDAYTVLLSISLVAMISACLVLWFDLKTYPTLTPGAGTSATRAAPAPEPTPPAPAPAPGDKPNP